MLKPYLPLAAMTALLTAAATVAQPQTTTDPSTSDTATQTTPSASTPATNPGSTTTGTATDTSTGTQGMHGGFRGTPADDTATGTSSATTTGDTSTSSATGTASATADPGATTSTAAAAAQLQDQDATFLRKALEGDRMEIASAQAALDQAERTDTKNAARMILDDHQRSSQALQALASRKGWTLPSASDTAESDQALMSTSGSGSFDDRFMADQIRMHREAISLYRAQASSGSDPDLRRFASDQLPHLEHHLEMLQGSHTQK